MRLSRSFFISLVLAGLSGSAAQAAMLTMICETRQATYDLVLDDEAGTMVATLGGSQTRHVFRNLRKENGTITGAGFVEGRGTDFTFSYRYTATITYAYGNGGKRTDECRVVSNR